MFLVELNHKVFILSNFLNGKMNSPDSLAYILNDVIFNIEYCSIVAFNVTWHVFFIFSAQITETAPAFFPASSWSPCLHWTQSLLLTSATVSPKGLPVSQPCQRTPRWPSMSTAMNQSQSLWPTCCLWSIPWTIRAARWVWVWAPVPPLQ